MTNSATVFSSAENILLMRSAANISGNWIGLGFGYADMAA
jgi:hypothetical protein